MIDTKWLRKKLALYKKKKSQQSLFSNRIYHYFSFSNEKFQTFMRCFYTHHMMNETKWKYITPLFYTQGMGEEKCY